MKAYKTGGISMNQFEMTPSAAFQTTTVGTAERTTAFLRSVYGWMCVGLGITAAVAFGVAQSDVGRVIATNPILYWGLWIATFGIAMFLQLRVQKIAPGTASVGFVLYAALTGAWLSVIFLAYSASVVGNAFLVTAGAFGAMAVFGTVTKRSLAGVGQFFYMGFVGIFLAMLLSVFWPAAGNSAGFQFGISVVGVLVFTGLAAWKAQELKQMAAALPEGRANVYAVLGALFLYITFINLFLMLLRLYGGGRRN
jgi:FtsH-binding integral membrane protein